LISITHCVSIEFESGSKSCVRLTSHDAKVSDRVIAVRYCDTATGVRSRYLRRRGHPLHVRMG